MTAKYDTKTGDVLIKYGEGEESVTHILSWVEACDFYHSFEIAMDMAYRNKEWGVKQ